MEKFLKKFDRAMRARAIILTVVLIAAFIQLVGWYEFPVEIVHFACGLISLISNGTLYELLTKNIEGLYESEHFCLWILFIAFSYILTFAIIVLMCCDDMLENEIIVMIICLADAIIFIISSVLSVTIEPSEDLW